MQQFRTRPWVTAGIALVGASVIAVTPVTQSGARMLSIELAAADITLDFVRHGESTDNVSDTIGTVPPGAHLTADGLQQAQDVAPVIQGEFPGGFDGIYASEFVRTQETAAPLADLLHTNVQVLPGLNEINAGMLEGLQLGRLGEILYIAAPFLWTLGLKWVPQWGSDIDPNGFAFDQRFSDAVQTIYDNSISDPNATDTDVAFSHAAAIMTWTLMNVDNPDPLLLLKDPLGNTGQVVIQGNPTDGWTLVSWNGDPVSQDPGMAGALFVDFRDLVMLPQAAFSNDIAQALAATDPATAMQALQDGAEHVSHALLGLLQFPTAVIDDIFNTAL